ncbi:hypothetical protein D1AOALGA4SA_6866 [Olavius algarvensis Delta 1 endosymbiont]|nr:hypothetical protein D1AOALGA4SA_6866 [Olavius algarvensis Delta 1 endosymbiont]
MTSIEYPESGIRYRASSIEYPVSNIEYQASSIVSLKATIFLLAPVVAKPILATPRFI